MGSGFSNMLKGSFHGKEPKRIIFVGLDGAGKTTILYQLKAGEFITTTPTISFNMEMVEFNDVRFAIWDLGGESHRRGLWSQYMKDTVGVVFVVDSSDVARLPEAMEVLHSLMQKKALRDTVLLVVANKQDLPGALNTTEIMQALCLTKIRTNWQVCTTSATFGNGLNECLPVLYDMLRYGNK